MAASYADEFDISVDLNQMISGKHIVRVLQEAMLPYKKLRFQRIFPTGHATIGFTEMSSESTLREKNVMTSRLALFNPIVKLVSKRLWIESNVGMFVVCAPSTANEAAQCAKIESLPR